MKAHHMAFPHDTAHLSEWERGLSKRELIAAMAMQGYRANANWHEEDAGVIAGWAVQDADALIAELSK